MTIYFSNQLWCQLRWWLWPLALVVLIVSISLQCDNVVSVDSSDHPGFKIYVSSWLDWLALLIVVAYTLHHTPSLHYRIVVVSPHNEMFPGLTRAHHEGRRWRLKNADPDGNVSNSDLQVQMAAKTFQLLRFISNFDFLFNIKLNPQIIKIKHQQGQMVPGSWS